MAMIFAKHGEESRVAQRLLALADNVRDVKVNTDSGVAFDVPEELYLKYLAVDAVVEDDETPVSADQVKRRPGRPRKVVPQTPKEGD